jgi:MoaA/NifB/PqqE/SkfB family radical SAM enzyme
MAHTSASDWQTVFTADWNLNGNAVEREQPFEAVHPSPAPKVVHFSVTDVCNLSCLHCDIWMRNPRAIGELGFEDWKALIDKLHGWLGPFILKFAGGEPFVKKWLPDLIAYAKSKDLYVGVTTNARLLKRDLVYRLSDIGLDEVNISLESLSPQIHDTTRNREGAHKTATDAMRYFKEAGVTQVNISTILMEPNLDEVIDLAWWVKESGYRTLTLQPIMQNFGEAYHPKWYLNSPLWPRDYDKVCAVIDAAADFRKKHWTIGNHADQLEMMKYYFANPELKPPSPCGAGKAEISIGPKGEMGLCFNLKEVGNAHESDPRALFETDEAYNRRAEIYHCSRNCYLLNCTMAEITAPTLVESMPVTRQSLFTKAPVSGRYAAL